MVCVVAQFHTLGYQKLYKYLDTLLTVIDYRLVKVLGGVFLYHGKSPVRVGDL